MNFCWSPGSRDATQKMFYYVIGFFCFSFFLFLAALAACGNSLARDGIHATAATPATAVSVSDP